MIETMRSARAHAPYAATAGNSTMTSTSADRKLNTSESREDPADRVSGISGRTAGKAMSPAVSDHARAARDVRRASTIATGKKTTTATGLAILERMSSG